MQHSDELPDGAVVLEIATSTKTFYKSIYLKRLREIFRIATSLEERNRLVWESTHPVAIDCDDQVNYSLVLDGENDEESWEELGEQLAADAKVDD